MDKLIELMRAHAWAAEEVANLLEQGDVLAAQSMAALAGLPLELYMDQINADGQEQLNHEHRVAVERRTA